MRASRLNLDDYERGPNGMARLYEDRIAELEAERADCRTREDRRPINQQLHALRAMLRWCKTRAGYHATPQELGLLD